MDTTVAKGLRVLEYLALADAPVRLSAVTQDLALPKSNVHRLLSTLAELGYVQREPGTGRYMCSLKTWELGCGIISAHPVKRAVAPYLQELHRLTSETATLSILDGHDVLVLDKILGPRNLKFTSRPGFRIPAGLNTSGIAMLSYEEDPEPIIREALAAEPSVPELTVGDVLKDIALARRQGYATMTKSRLNEGVIAVAVALPTRDGRRTAAISVSGPTERLKDKRFEQAIEAARMVSANIAHAHGKL